MPHNMQGAAGVNLYAPFKTDTILEVRQGKMKPLEGLKIESGIDKQLVNDYVTIGKLGIDGDEHDPTFHGGPEKAVHGYCSSHYPDWQAEFPESASRFVPGGFGENLVTRHLNERNICIGDVVSIGGEDGVTLQVSLPRQPCFKLNHRFQLKGFAPNTWKHSRTGWYYRVLSGGRIRAGDEIRLVERQWPDWTIERLQKYMYFEKDDMAINEYLAGLEVIGKETRDMFVGRVAKQKAAGKKAAQAKIKWRAYKLVEKKRQTPRVASFVFEPVEPDEDPEPLGEGAHARIKLANGLERSYSVVTGDRKRFELGIAKADNSRGASKYLHDSVQVGELVQVGSMTADVPGAGASSHRVFVAGGIGITAFLSLMEGMQKIHWSFELHYAIRSETEIPFSDRLDKLGDKVIYYDKSKGQRLSIHNIIKNMQWNSFLYFCGPTTMMEEALRETKAQGIPQSEVHYEAFAAETGGDPFEAVIANRDEKLLNVEADETLLDELRKHFDDAQSSCEVGNCGTCKIRLKSGRVEHRGTALLEEEKKDWMLSCVSRGIGRIVVEL